MEEALASRPPAARQGPREPGSLASMVMQGTFGALSSRPWFGGSSNLSRRRRRGRFIAWTALVLVLAVAVGSTMFVKGILAAPFDLKAIPPAPRPVLLLAADGTQFGSIRPAERREIIAPEDIPEVMRQAIISAEDARFLDHSGVDVTATLRAAYRDITDGRRQGGSTITQQFVKYAYVGDERTLTRKVREAGFAVQLETRKSKEEILTDYLNVLYLGNSAYGVQAASKYYFGVSIKDLAKNPTRPGSSDDRILALARASMLAGIAPAPSIWNPVADFKTARERQKYTLNQMVLNEHITPVEASAAFDRVKDVMPLQQTDPDPPSTAPEYADLVKAQLKIAYKDDPDRFDRGGFRVKTALDTDLQEAVTRAVREVLPAPTDPQAAVVAIDITNGDVKALTTLRRFPAKGARPAVDGYERGGFNLATNANRSTGSTIKPFTLATALQNGLTLDTTRPAPGCDTIRDRNAKGGVYRYCNAGGETSASRGSLTLRSALQRSVNTVYVPLAIEVGRDKVKQVMLASGIVANEAAFDTLPSSFGLGTTALVTPLSMANAFGTLVNKGQYMKPRFILETREADGAVIKKAPERPPAARRALPADVADKVAEAMSGVTADAGTAPGARQSFPVFGKTGTTNDSTDAWFVGCARAPQNLCIATWMGYEDQVCTGIAGTSCGGMKDAGRPSLLDPRYDQVYGGTLPAQVFTRTFQILEEIRAARLPQPAIILPSPVPSESASTQAPADSPGLRTSPSPTAPRLTVTSPAPVPDPEPTFTIPSFSPEPLPSASPSPTGQFLRRRP